jgi:hypothetical protein
MTKEDQILSELKEMKADGKETKTAVQNSALAVTRIEGDIKLHGNQIDRNEADIARHQVDRKDSDRRLHDKIEGVDRKLNKMVVKVASAATAAGAAAGGVINAVMTRINGG